MNEKRAKSWLSLFLAVTVFIQLNSYGAAIQARDTLSLGAYLAGNQTLISKNVTFELGFFSPNGTNNWYIGIWFANIQEKVIVWVTNREIPARSKPGILKLSGEGELNMFDADGASIWSVNTSSKASRAVILDSGNLLMLSDANKPETVAEFRQSYIYLVACDEIRGKTKAGLLEKLLGISPINWIHLVPTNSCKYGIIL